MNLNIEVDHEWQARVIRDLAGFLTGEHPMAGPVISALFAVNLKFEDGCVNGYVKAELQGEDREMEVYQLANLGALAMVRLEHAVTSSGGSKELAREIFMRGLEQLAPQYDNSFPSSDSANVEEAMAKARKHFHGRKPE